MSTSATANAFFTPTQISGCQLWLDAADEGVFTLRGSNVFQWRDKSANRYIATPRNNAQTPVRYRGFNNLFTVESSVVTATGNTLLISSLPSSNLQGPTGLSFFLISKFLSGDVFIQYESPRILSFEGTTRFDYGETNVVYSYPPGYTNTSNYMLSYDISVGTSNLAFRYNGLLLSNYSVNPVTSQFTATLGLFGRGSADNVPGFGQISEFICYNTTLPIAQRQQVEGYLAWKWGLQSSLPASHPYKTSPIPPLLSPPVSFPSGNANRFFLPTQFTGCQLWLDAADRNTITLSGLNVSRWNDKSGNGNNGSVVGTIQYIGKINGITVMNFPGTASTYFTGAVSNSGTTLTAFSVFVMNITSYTSARIISLAKSGSTDFANVLYTTPISRLNTNFVAYRANATRGSIAATFGVPSLVSSLYNGTTNTLYLNGTASTAVSSTGNFGYTNYEIGGSFGEENLVPLNGVVGEVILYSTALTTAQIQQVEGYLAWKWGLQGNLPASHPYKNSPIPPLSNPPTSLPAVVSGMWTPRNLSGLQFWLDAADTSSLTLVGNSVSQMNDKSGNSYNATQTTAASRPFFSRNSITFSNNTYFDFPQAAINNTTRYALFLVFYPIASVNWILQKQANGVGSYNMLSMTNFWQNNTGVANYLYWAPHANTGVLNAGTALSLSTLQLIEVLFDGTTLSFYRNGTLLNSVTSGATLTIVNQLSATNCTIGSWRPDGGIQNPGVTNFQMNELSYYNVSLTTAQRQQIEGYLAWKWGLQGNLPADHPWKRWPPAP